MNPDVVIVDFNSDDGKEGHVCEKLKSNPETHYLPIIAISDIPNIALQANKFGIYGLLKRQFEPNKLAKTIKNAIEGIKHSRELHRQ